MIEQVQVSASSDDDPEVALHTLAKYEMDVVLRNADARMLIVAQ